MLDDGMPGYNPAFLKRVLANRRKPADADKGLGRDAASKIRQQVAQAMEAVAREALAEAIEQARATVASARDQARLILTNAEREANEVLRSAGVTVEGEKPNPNAIIREVASTHGFTAGMLKGPSKHKHTVAARHEAMARVYVARPDMTLGQIGMIFGRRDHSTVSHALDKIGARKSETARPHQERKP